MSIKKIKILLFILIQFLIFNTYGQEDKKIEIRKNYVCNLSDVISRLQQNDSIVINQFVASIPTTKAEFAIFYHYFENSKTKELFKKLNKKIADNAYWQTPNIFKPYIEMAEFIDGSSVGDEYIGDYYNDLDFILEYNYKKFCKMYNTLTENKKHNLKDFYEKYCK